MDKHTAFLVEVLGARGSEALLKAVRKSEILAQVLVPRAIIGWALNAATYGYTGPIPGQEQTFVELRKSETSGLYSGAISARGDTVTFTDSTLYRLAAHLALAIDAEPGVPHERLKSIDLTRLGKSVDVLAKSQMLSKASRAPRVMSRHGSLEVWHDGLGIHPFSIHKVGTGQLVMDGLTSLADAQKHASSYGETKDGAANTQFGKVELPGQTNKPQAQQAPLAPQQPQKQPKIQGQPVQPDKQGKPVKAPPRTPDKAPSVKIAAPSLTVGKSEAHGNRCPMCAQLQFAPDGEFTGCVCFAALAKYTRTETDGESYRVTFESGWDSDALEVLVEALYSN